MLSAGWQLAAATLRGAAPLVYATLGGWCAERAGVVNLALEGLLLSGAFAAAVVAHTTHSAWLGALAGGLGGLALAAVYGLLVLRWRANQIVAGMGLNLLAAGLTPVLCKMLYDDTGRTPSLTLAERWQVAPLYGCWLLVAVAWFVARYTRWGLWHGFAGEQPAALDAAGVGVNRVRWVAVLTGGVVAGWGGAALSLGASSCFSRDLAAGRGYMALAALIFGRWRPVPAALACLLFGFCEAALDRLQGVRFGSGEPVPVQFIQILPYVVTILVLAGWAGAARPPRALGTVFSREGNH